MSSHNTQEGHVIAIHDFGSAMERPLDTFFSSHNFMVTALGSFVKWPSIGREGMFFVIGG
jgi:hypothetical protein